VGVFIQVEVIGGALGKLLRQSFQVVCLAQLRADGIEALLYSLMRRIYLNLERG
jgi:hypothetical protein